MFGWFQPKCPIADDVRDWIERRTGWIGKEFGWDRVRRTTVILPTPVYFPDTYKGSDKDIQGLLDRVCRQMRMDAGRLKLTLVDRPTARIVPGPTPGHSPLAAADAEEETRSTVRIDTEDLDDPLMVIAALSRGVARVHLLDRGIASDADDLDPLTDLLAIVLGFGVFTANSIFRDGRWMIGHYHGWSLSKQGYLTAPMLGYALALFAWRRDETAPDWAEYLLRHIQTPLRHGIRYLQFRAECDEDDRLLRTNERMHSGKSEEARLAPIDDEADSVLQEETDRSQLDVDAEPEVAGSWDENDADYWFTHGINDARVGDHNTAVSSYSESLKRSPDDAEVLEHRGLSYAQLGQYTEALSDAQAALRLDPENISAYHLRGRALFGLKQFVGAIADFTVALKDQRIRGEVYYLRGLAHAADGQHNQALKDFNRAAQEVPTLAEVYLARAETYERLGQLGEAAADRAEAVRRNPFILKETRVHDSK